MAINSHGELIRKPFHLRYADMSFANEMQPSIRDPQSL